MVVFFVQLHFTTRVRYGFLSVQLNYTIRQIPAFKEECKRSMFPSSFENEGDKKNLVLKNCIDTSQGWCNIRIDAVMELYPVLILNKNVLSELQYRSNSYYWEAKQ